MAKKLKKIGPVAGENLFVESNDSDTYAVVGGQNGHCYFWGNQNACQEFLTKFLNEKGK